MEKYPLERFACLFNATSDRADGNVPFPHLADGEANQCSVFSRTRKKTVSLTSLVRSELDEPSFLALIAEQCGQVRHFRETKGCLPEPLWYANVELAAFCQDGKTLAHEWSSGDERYTYEETQERLDRARNFGPTTCVKFHSLKLDICEKCPHWVAKKFKSPIVLGRITPGPTPNHGTEQSSSPSEAINWEHTQGGALKSKSYRNAHSGLQTLGLSFRHDSFHDRKFIEGDALAEGGGELSDALCRELREILIRRFSVDPGADNVKEAAERLCEANPFDPIRDYLNGLRWDGQRRLERLLLDYFGAPDTELNRALGRIILTAAVRRARKPGCKFDLIVVLEGLEGKNKSSAIEILAGKENFSDQTILGQSDREQQEKLKGVWLYEIADLTGMKRADVEHVKAFASRTHDRARPAYGRFLVNQPRRCVFIATTNETVYLKSQTGNRRFLPVKTGNIDNEALVRDRDQLWAEAACLEAKGHSIELPRELWKAAHEEQEQRRETDPWEDALADVEGEVIEGEERISSAKLLALELGIPRDRQTDVHSKRLGRVMRRLGWQGPKSIWIECRTQRGYRRPTSKAPAGGGEAPRRRRPLTSQARG